MSSISSTSDTSRVKPLPQRAIDVVESRILPTGFETVALAARGAFSEVWKIRDSKTGVHYALKRLRADWREEPVGRQLLSNEVHVGQRIESPHVVRVVLADLNCRDSYEVLEWIDGVTLEQKLREGKRLPAAIAVWVARQCAQGLSDLARVGFTHGDLKPSNILIDSSGEAKLIDLGFAQPIRDLPAVRQPHLVVGTAEYMAPENLSRGRFNPVLKDMYSLGITLFRMLTGRLPFEAETPADVLRLQRSKRPAPLHRWCPSAPRALTGLVQRLLAKQPIRRPQSPAALVRELIAVELSLLSDRFAGS